MKKSQRESTRDVAGEGKLENGRVPLSWERIRQGWTILIELCLSKFEGEDIKGKANLGKASQA